MTIANEAKRDPLAAPGLQALAAYQDILAEREHLLSSHLDKLLRKLEAQERQLTGQSRLVHDLQFMLQPPVVNGYDACGIRAAVRCHSADSRLRVGGDWYLLLQLADSSLFLAVGDTEGHGLDAVPAMIQLRHTMAALATEGYPPGVILGKLNELLLHGGQLTASALAARYRPRDGRFTWASAGHPPVLAFSEGQARVLPSPDGPLLGVVSAPGYGQAACELARGDGVLLYTDGIFVRGQDPDDEIRALSARLSAAARPADFLDALNLAASGDDASVLLAERVR